MEIYGMETPEQRAERIFKEDADEQDNEQKELLERKKKRQAVVAKHRDVLDASITGKQKGIRFRTYFHAYVIRTAYKNFLTEEEEYMYIGKPDRNHWTSIENISKAYKPKDPMCLVIGEIMKEFGCFDY